MIFVLPNILTYLRIMAVPLTSLLLAYDYKYTATFLFVLACITDYFDGHLARIMNLRSTLGTILDPIADKLLVCSVFIVLVANQTIAQTHVVAVICIIGRELLVSGLREYLADTQIKLPVTFLAKIKTAAQMLALILLMLDNRLLFVGNALLWFAALLTIYTGYAYLNTCVQYAIKQDNSMT